MLNEEKIKYMTRAAVYEERGGKKNIEISEYYKGDYVSFYMLRSAIAYTIAYGILLGMWGSCQMQEIMAQISRISYLQGLIRDILVLYVIGLVLYEIVAGLFFSWKYRKAKKSVAEFNDNLRQIRKFYENEASAASEKMTVRGVSEDDDDFGV